MPLADPEAGRRRLFGPIMRDRRHEACAWPMQGRGDSPRNSPNTDRPPRVRDHFAGLARILENQSWGAGVSTAAPVRVDSEAITGALAQSRRVAESISARQAAAPSGPLRQALAAASHRLAIEHHRAIIEAVGAGCIGSACALLRCQVDAHVQGLYLAECLSDDALQKFIADRSGPSSGTMRRAVLAVARIRKGGLGALLQDHGSALNSYTHAGMFQLGRRLPEGGIGPAYGELETVAVLAFADGVASRSFAACRPIVVKGD